MNDRIRRPLNWYGSKERVSGDIHALIPPDIDTWVDLFCGSAIVTLAKPRHKREVINDRDGRIVNLFHVLRDPILSAGLYRLVELTPFAQDQLRQVYVNPPGPDPVERAWHFLVSAWFKRAGDANKTGFRWSKGNTNSPEQTWATLPARLAPVADRLRGICIRNEDFRKIIADYNTPTCLIYADPPYPGDVGRRYAVKMTEADHADLAQALRATHARVILSMNPGTLYDCALSDWHRMDIAVMDGNARTKGEVMFLNFDPNPLFAAGGLA